MDTMITKKKGLNPRQRKFCLLRTSGLSQIEAYRKAGFTGKYGSASELEHKPEVTEEIRRLQEKAEEKVFDLQTECRKFDPTNIATLQSIVTDSTTNPRGKIAAIKELLDRGHGKPKEAVEEKVTLIWDV